MVIKYAIGNKQDIEDLEHEIHLFRKSKESNYNSEFWARIICNEDLTLFAIVIDEKDIIDLDLKKVELIAELPASFDYLKQQDEELL